MKTHIGEVDVNVCKSDSCHNMAQPRCSDYQSPTYHLGYPALYCKACGSNNQLLSNQDINLLLHDKLTRYAKTVIKSCPHCFSADKRRYGATLKGSIRWQCRNCRAVYSASRPSSQQLSRLSLLADRLFSGDDFKTIITQLQVSYSGFYRLLAQLNERLNEVSGQMESTGLKPTSLHIATQSARLPCQKVDPQRDELQLWALISSESNSGYVLLENVNYTQLAVSEQSVYRSHHAAAKPVAQKRVVDEILQRYRSFFERTSLDELNYCHAAINDERGVALMPVVTAQVHFHELHSRFTDHTFYHYLEHEVLIRGACLTAFGQSIVNGQSHLFYLVESDNASINRRFRLKATYSLGWWKNSWYEFYCPADQSYRWLATLTPKNRIDPAQLSRLPATFHPSQRFIQRFRTAVGDRRLASLRPETIQMLLTIFKTYYNYCCIDSHQKTAAQKLGIVDRRYRLSQLITNELTEPSLATAAPRP
jgi:transposase-like protein